MRRAIPLAITAFLALHAADTWSKVRDIKSGIELRILKVGSKQPILAFMDEANEERIIVVVKNEQVSIPKDDIEQLDARPHKGGRKVVSKSETKVEDPKPPTAPVPSGPQRPTVSSGGGLSFEGKPGFETVYRRPR